MEKPKSTKTTKMTILRALIISLTLPFSFASFYPDISDETQCKCVPQHLCADTDGSSNGHGLIDIRFEDDACPNFYEVCCDHPIEEEKAAKEDQKPSKKCGVSHSGGVVPRITSNSEVSQFGELPWTVLVLQKDRKSERNSFICGGSLIHPQVVVTAAHCVSPGDPSLVKVRAGEWNIRKTDEALPHQDATVREIVPHANYKPGILWNDVALLVVGRAFAVTANIGFVCLPTRPRQAAEEGCVASGWGKPSFGKGGRHSSLLRKVTLPLISRSKCQAALRSTRLGKFYKLHKSFICAGGERNKDTCKGDGGSPLICPVLGQSGRFVQMGIVSWGIGCGADRTPGVYVNVPFFTAWIDKQMEARNFTTSYYKM